MRGAFLSKARLHSRDLGKLLKRKKRPKSNSAVARKVDSSEALKHKSNSRSQVH